MDNENLINLIPEDIANVKDYKRIMTTCEKLFTGIDEDLEKILSNMFIDTADIETLKKKLDDLKRTGYQEQGSMTDEEYLAYLRNYYKTYVYGKRIGVRNKILEDVIKILYGSIIQGAKDACGYGSFKYMYKRLDTPSRNRYFRITPTAFGRGFFGRQMVEDLVSNNIVNSGNRHSLSLCDEDLLEKDKYYEYEYQMERVDNGKHVDPNEYLYGVRDYPFDIETWGIQCFNDEEQVLFINIHPDVMAQPDATQRVRDVEDYLHENLPATITPVFYTYLYGMSHTYLGTFDEYWDNGGNARHYYASLRYSHTNIPITGVAAHWIFKNDRYFKKQDSEGNDMFFKSVNFWEQINTVDKFEGRSEILDSDSLNKRRFRYAFDSVTNKRPYTKMIMLNYPVLIIETTFPDTPYVFPRENILLGRMSTTTTVEDDPNRSIRKIPFGLTRKGTRKLEVRASTYNSGEIPFGLTRKGTRKLEVRASTYNSGEIPFGTVNYFATP